MIGNPHKISFFIFARLSILFILHFILVIAVNAQEIKLYHCMVDLTPANLPIMRKYGFTEAKLIDGRYIDPKKEGNVDSVFLTNSILEFFPDVNASGMGLLDLEDRNFNVLLKDSTDPYFSKGIDEMIKMIRIAKTLRPFVSWSIYNIPYSTYWQKDEIWKSQGVRLLALLDYVDVLTPALYDHYPDTTNFSDDISYIDENLTLALSIGRELGKPVMPYIWHRWHEGNLKDGLFLIDKPEFKKSLHQILTTEYNDYRICGLIWFDAQTHFYRIKDGLRENDAKKLKIHTRKTGVRVLDKYGKIISNMAKKSRQTRIR